MEFQCLATYDNSISRCYDCDNEVAVGRSKKLSECLDFLKKQAGGPPPDTGPGTRLTAHSEICRQLSFSKLHSYNSVWWARYCNSVGKKYDPHVAMQACQWWLILHMSEYLTFAINIRPRKVDFLFLRHSRIHFETPASIFLSKNDAHIFVK